jgi:hypothetical protein
MEIVKKYLPHILVIFAFAVVSYMFTPQVFQGKVVNQPDIASWRGMANEIISYNEANPGKDPALWTNSMFSGMPATTISVKYKGDYTDYIYKLLFVGVRPPSYLLISLAGAFLMFLAFGVNIWLSAIGAVAVAFCAYNPQIIQVGHNSKMVAIAFMPWVLAAVAYSYRKKAFAGALLFALALSFQIKANHPQITYYLAIIILGYAISELVRYIKERKFLKYLKISGYLLVAGLLGVATNINHLWPTYEYSKYTMRGGSELRSENNSETEKEKGLDVAYATQWSYSPGETPNLMIPNFNGGSSAGALSTDSETYKLLKDNGYQGVNQIIRQMPLYWGPQPFTAGPMYIGAVSVFLFVLGLIVMKGGQKWWIAVVTLLAILLSWGANLMFLTEFFFKYAPLYNKFRTVSMVLVILQITIPLLAFATVDNMLKQGVEEKKFRKGLVTALAITGGFALIMTVIPSLAGSFSSPADTRLPGELRNTLIQDRISLLRADAFRSLVYILFTAGALWFTLVKKLKPAYFYFVLGVLVIADLWSVDKRYLNNSHFITERSFSDQYAKRPVDERILEDKDPDYRVLDLTVDMFNDSHVSYHHKTIGGYSPAKLQRYQDIIDYYLREEISRIGKDIGNSKTIEEAQSALGKYPVLNMLNTKYIIVGDKNPPLVNKEAMGNCWFVDSVTLVSDAKEEIMRLGQKDLGKVAIVSKTFENILPEIAYENTDIADSIKLTFYSPNKLVYNSGASKDRIAVFSEVYYPAGWSATIDGEPAELFRADYLLRALAVPAGKHEIEFLYRPESFVKGAIYSKVSSGILLLLILFGLSFEVVSKGKKKSREIEKG